jgi:hypothetical protein
MKIISPVCFFLWSSFGAKYYTLVFNAVKTKLASSLYMKNFDTGTSTLSIMTPSIMTLSIMTLSIMTLSIMSLSIMTLSIMKPSLITLSIMAEHCYAECQLYSVPFTISVIILSVYRPLQSMFTNCVCHNLRYYRHISL